MKKQFHLTNDGIQELKTELDDLKSRRGDIADRIKTAREFGDLSENAEYSAAMQEKEKADNRVTEIEHILQNVEVIKKPKAGNKVQLGNKVLLKGGGKTKEFQVVGTVEADPLSGKISDESPIGQALIGRQVGDEVEIVTPSETSTFKVSHIS